MRKWTAIFSATSFANPPGNFVEEKELKITLESDAKKTQVEISVFRKLIDFSYENKDHGRCFQRVELTSLTNQTTGEVWTYERTEEGELKCNLEK